MTLACAKGGRGQRAAMWQHTLLFQLPQNTDVSLWLLSCPRVITYTRYWKKLQHLLKWKCITSVITKTKGWGAVFVSPKHARNFNYLQIIFIWRSHILRAQWFWERNQIAPRQKYLLQAGTRCSELCQLPAAALPPPALLRLLWEMIQVSGTAGDGALQGNLIHVTAASQASCWRWLTLPSAD